MTDTKQNKAEIREECLEVGACKRSMLRRKGHDSDENRVCLGLEVEDRVNYEGVVIGGSYLAV